MQVASSFISLPADSTEAPTAEMSDLQLALQHTSLPPPPRPPRPTRSTLLATFPPELILHIRKHVLELEGSKDEWVNAKVAHRTSEGLRRVSVAWYGALADDVTEMAAWSSRGCEALAEYLEKNGRGARVQRLVVNPKLFNDQAPPVVVSSRPPRIWRDSSSPSTRETSTSSESFLASRTSLFGTSRCLPLLPGGAP